MGQFMRLVTRYLRPYARREAEMFVYMLFGLGFTMVFPLAFRRLLDKAIPSGEFSQVLSILTVLGVAFVVSLKPGLEGYIVPSKLYGILAAGRPFVAAVDPSCEVATIATQQE